MTLRKWFLFFSTLCFVNSISHAQWIKQLDVGVVPYFINKNVGWATGNDLYRTTNSIEVINNALAGVGNPTNSDT